MTTRGYYNDSTLFRRLLRQTLPYWPHCVVLILLSLLLSPLALLTPLPLKIVVDSAIDSRPLPGFLESLLPGEPPHSSAAVLLLAVCLVVAVALLMGIVELAISVLTAYVGQNLTVRLRSQLFRHAQRLSFLYHDTRGVTDSGYRIQYDAQSISVIVASGIPSLAGAIVTLIGMIYVTFRIDWQLALVALAISPFLFLGAWAYRVPLRSSWREVRRLESSALSVAQEVLGAMRVVTAFGQEAREGERFVRRSGDSVRRYIRVTFVEGTYTLLIGLSIGLGTAAVLLIGVRHVQSGTLTLGDLLLVMGYLTQLYVPVKSLSKNVGKMQQALASMERTFSLLDEVPDVAERPNARPLSRASGAVAFCAVSFAYRKGRPVVRNVSFEVEPGTRLGISGTTGAGKSTLVNLLTRFYDPTEGVIKLDGVDLRDYKLADLRNQFAIVLQDPVLFSTSIAENIAYSRPDASEEEVVEAAKASNAHEFIAALPHGYETQVGERGMSLSGGERQRIALARAFLRDAPILILDEPTSSVDVKTEAAIMEAMERLMKGRTTFMIAHRLGTLANCDVRLEVEDGRVVKFEEQGLTAVAGQANNEAGSLHRSKEIEDRARAVDGELVPNDSHNGSSRARMTVAEAARVLGISESALRKRVNRGKLEHEHTPDGRLMVYLKSAATSGTSRERVLDESHDAKTERYVRSLEDRVGYLRDGLDQEREANRENSRIVTDLQERIGKLEASQMARLEPERREPHFPIEDPDDPNEGDEHPRVHYSPEDLKNDAVWAQFFVTAGASIVAAAVLVVSVLNGQVVLAGLAGGLTLLSILSFLSHWVLFR